MLSIDVQLLYVVGCSTTFYKTCGQLSNDECRELHLQLSHNISYSFFYKEKPDRYMLVRYVRYSVQNFPRYSTEQLTL